MNSPASWSWSLERAQAPQQVALQPALQLQRTRSLPPQLEIAAWRRLQRRSSRDTSTATMT